jgi:hypothetical protein
MMQMALMAGLVVVGILIGITALVAIGLLI